jgi:hypothetical protein
VLHSLVHSREHSNTAAFCCWAYLTRKSCNRQGTLPRKSCNRQFLGTGNANARHAHQTCLLQPSPAGQVTRVMEVHNFDHLYRQVPCCKLPLISLDGLLRQSAQRCGVSCTINLCNLSYRYWYLTHCDHQLLFSSFNDTTLGLSKVLTSLGRSNFNKPMRVPTMSGQILLLYPTSSESEKSPVLINDRCLN